MLNKAKNVFYMWFWWAGFVCLFVCLLGVCVVFFLLEVGYYAFSITASRGPSKRN